LTIVAFDEWKKGLEITLSRGGYEWVKEPELMLVEKTITRIKLA